MKVSDFRIGLEFYMGGGHWRCTDVGTRTIIAICIDPDQLDCHGRHMNSSWFEGPPYAVLEEVLDECDLEDCSLEKEEQ